MGEHKLRVTNGDGEKPKSVSLHMVEAFHEYTAETGNLAAGIEAAYTRLSERAKTEDSLIVTVSQAMSTYTVGDSSFVLVVLTAQRISREDFERQQRIAQFGPGGPRR